MMGFGSSVLSSIVSICIYCVDGIVQFFVGTNKIESYNNSNNSKVLLGACIHRPDAPIGSKHNVIITNTL